MASIREAFAEQSCRTGPKARPLFCGLANSSCHPHLFQSLLYFSISITYHQTFTVDLTAKQAIYPNKGVIHRRTSSRIQRLAFEVMTNDIFGLWLAENKAISSTNITVTIIGIMISGGGLMYQFHWPSSYQSYSEKGQSSFIVSTR